MITLYGVTEDGVSIPVQVTEEGKLVVLNNGLKPGDDLECKNLDASGSITAAGVVESGAGYENVSIEPGVNAKVTITSAEDQAGSDANAIALQLRKYPTKGVSAGAYNAFEVRNNGSISAAGAKCGFTSSGELYFTSRNQRWKCVVQGGNVMAEEYTRAMEIQEKAEHRQPKTQEKAEQLRQPKTQDIVPED